MNYRYLDHNATTPLHPEVAEAMSACLRAEGGGSLGFGNPSSLHAAGRAARSLVEDARESVARLLSVSPSEIVFTSGGTEADNLAIFGATASGKLKGRHLVVSSFEHPAVLEAFRKLESEGWDVTWVSPDGNGIVTAEAVERALRPDTGLVSVMAANNEIGTVLPVADIGKLLRGRGILFHCDAVQALGKILETHPRKWGADYVALSAHKINGPKGIGALYVRKGAPLVGSILGGPQERQFRGGTENVPGIVGFGKAAEVTARLGAEENTRLASLRDRLETAMRARLPEAVVNGAAAPRLANTLNVTLPGCPADLLVMGLDMRGIAVSAGSACASGSVKSSHVLLAMGKGKEAASSSIRFSLGRGNDEDDIEPVVAALADVAASVRSL